MEHLALDYPGTRLGTALLIQADCLEWFRRIPEAGLHAIVTDPPYAIKEYEPDQLAKRAAGRGGIWRLPPAHDGAVRAPQPRFTALSPRVRQTVRDFFIAWARAALPALRPGAHLFLASNAFLSQLIFAALIEGGFEFRGEIIRLIQTGRGGDRPKLAEQEYPEVQSLPRGKYEPWGLFRKPLPSGMRVREALHEFGTGGIRRTPDGRHFGDVIASGITPDRERAIADHPSIKPQAFLRQIVWAALPLGTGVIADPFAGSGSTLAAATAMGLAAVGVERRAEYYDMAREAIPRLAALSMTETDSPAEESVAAVAWERPRLF
jgi:site-specific DNA-methyltransferase (adenine-specific)